MTLSLPDDQHPERAGRLPLRRSLTLPWLVFYGLGVTIGAGIFALIGEIVGLAGAAAPMSFLVAGLIASMTGVSYAVLVSQYPLAGGEAVFATRGFGGMAGQLAGFGVAVTGIISSATVSLAFAGYAGQLIGLPEPALVVALVVLLTGVACYGVRESVALAAVITVLELGTLLLVVVFGLPFLEGAPPFAELTGFSSGFAGLAPMLMGAVIAFFAFVGFEDIVNMAEETVDPRRTVGRAIVWTLVLTVVVYVVLSLVAVSVPGRSELAGSAAPMALLFETVTGLDGTAVSALAAFAMLNGVLIQMVMSARVLYGMANEGLVPAFLGTVHAGRRTPVRATVIVAGLILALALSLPMLRLAEMTSFVTLSVFALVNLSLFAIGRRGEFERLFRWRYWGLAGTAMCVAILGFQIAVGIAAGH